MNLKIPETRDEVPGCPWCGCKAEKATIEHCCWTCPKMLFPSNTASFPTDQLTFRLGWPKCASNDSSPDSQCVAVDVLG